MFGSEILDIAVGMIFIYLLLSLICSAINELIERSYKHRATDLEQGLRELLDDKDGTGLVQKVYDHGMINGLFKGDNKPSDSDKTNLPSYIPSRNFALAMLGILVPNSPAAGTTVNFLDAVGKIENAKVKNALTAMLNLAGDDVEKFRESIENWFNSTMDRVSGWCKRRSQIIVFWLGFAIAGVMNVSSVSIANDLWVHKAQRDALVSASQGYLGSHSVEDVQKESGLNSNIREWFAHRLERRLASCFTPRQRPMGTIQILGALCVLVSTGVAGYCLRGLTRRALLVRYAEQGHRGAIYD